MSMKKFYICEKCGNIAGKIHDSGVPMVCCGQKMTRLEPGTVDASREKHVPVISVNGNTVRVDIGTVAHPMTEEHYIEWIEVINGSYVNRCHLKPGDKPQATFYVPLSPSLIIRESCNKHGIWQITGKGEK